MPTATIGDAFLWHIDTRLHLTEAAPVPPVYRCSEGHEANLVGIALIDLDGITTRHCIVCLTRWLRDRIPTCARVA